MSAQELCRAVQAVFGMPEPSPGEFAELFAFCASRGLLAASSKPSVQQWIRDLTSRYVDVFAKFHSQAAQRFTIWTQNFNERYV
jgi:hypothetical protein